MSKAPPIGPIYNGAVKCTTHQRTFCPAAKCQREVNSRDDDEIVREIRASKQQPTTPKGDKEIPKEIRDLLPGLFPEA